MGVGKEHRVVDLNATGERGRNARRNVMKRLSAAVSWVGGGFCFASYSRAAAGLPNAEGESRELRKVIILAEGQVWKGLVRLGLRLSIRFRRGKSCAPLMVNNCSCVQTESRQCRKGAIYARTLYMKVQNFMGNPIDKIALKHLRLAADIYTLFTR